MQKLKKVKPITVAIDGGHQKHQKHKQTTDLSIHLVQKVKNISLLIKHS